MARGRKTAGCRGQASVEVVAVLPLIALCALVALQIVLAGAALWSAGVAARAGARAEQVGGDVGLAVREALPRPLRGGAHVRIGDPVRVAVAVPRVLPALPLLRVGAASDLDPVADG